MKLIITTKYNVIKLDTDNFTKEVLDEILSMPYIVKVEKEEDIKKKVREKNDNNKR